MLGDLGQAFGELGNILGVCPCCGDLFYLPETRPYLVGRQPHSIVDRLRRAEERLAREEEQLAEVELILREKAASAGLRTAKKLLKKIDPVFGGAGFDPHDVKVIFDPVTYVVFNGMSKGTIREIVLLAAHPQSSATERLYTSIERSINRGDIQFQTLQVGNDGKVASR